MNISNYFYLQSFFEPTFTFAADVVRDHGTIIISTIAIALIVFGLAFKNKKLVYSAHHDSNSTIFNDSFDKAFEKYKVSAKIEHIDLIVPDYRSRMRELTKKGVCFGLVAVFFMLVSQYPNQSPTELAKKVVLEDAIFNQLTRIDRPCCNEPRYSSEWFPEEIDLSGIIPWKEKPMAYYKGALDQEDSWIKSVSSCINGDEDFMGRLTFRVSEASSHTFAFWKKGTELGLFDYGSVYCYENSESLFKAIRSTALEYRMDTVYVKDEERAKYKFFPIATLMKA